MILAEKIMQLRKKNGWSQEELAEKLNVSRQSVSKWESAQSIPDLNKILLMSELFGVSTDYLLKDEIVDGPAEPVVEEQPIDSAAHFVSMEEANRFLDAKELTAPRVALATSLCILSPIPLFILGALSQITNGKGISRYITENGAVGIGMTSLLLMITAAVAIFLSCRRYTADFDYLDKEVIDTAYGVSSMAKELKTNYRDRYDRNNMLGACLCVLSAVPLFTAVWHSQFGADENLAAAIGLCIMLAIIAFAVNRFISVGIIWESYQKLLQEGDYSRKKKSHKAFDDFYWPLVTAIYFLYSFSTGHWHISWIIWLFASPIQKLILSFLKK